jgi:hypothetical protein
MARKQVAVTLRKPPQADTDSFVASGAETEPASAKKPKTAIQARRAEIEEVVTRPDGRTFRELTVYLPADLARRLSLLCMESDRDVSNFMAEMLRENLDDQSAPAPELTPVTLQSLLIDNLEIGRAKVLTVWRNLTCLVRS